MFYQRLFEKFSFVGVISKDRYLKHKPFKYPYETIFVVGLSYPSKILPKKENYLKASIYTYGIDYHQVLKSYLEEFSSDDSLILVDNHNLDEKLCLELTGLAYLGKNNLMIHKEYGTFFFIGLLLTKKKYSEVIIENNDSCGTCDVCIKACPMNALVNGYNEEKCLSALNQLKKPLPDLAIEKNYLLLGCDICQHVCPKNKNIKESKIKEFIPKEHAYVLTEDLFKLSNKEFKNKYGNSAYHFRGRTILLRNALTILYNTNNKKYNELIKETINNKKYPLWYQEDAKRILRKLEEK